MAELVVKKWQFGRFLAAKNTEKPLFTYPNPHYTCPSPRFTYPKPQASALPRTGNTITAVQKRCYRSAGMMRPRCGNL